VFKNKDDGEDRALLSPFEFEGDADKLPRKCMYMAVDCVVYGVEYVLPDHPKAIFAAVTKQPPIWLCRANTMSF